MLGVSFLGGDLSSPIAFAFSIVEQLLPQFHSETCHSVSHQVSFHLIILICTRCNFINFLNKYRPEADICPQ